jgi:hypothetical protein
VAKVFIAPKPNGNYAGASSKERLADIFKAAGLTLSATYEVEVDEPLVPKWWSLQLYDSYEGRYMVNLQCKTREAALDAFSNIVDVTDTHVAELHRTGTCKMAPNAGYGKTWSLKAVL